MKRFCSLSVAVLTAAVLSACGGGGSTDAGSTTTYATQAAWTNLYSAGSHAWALSGTATYQPASGGSGSYPTTATLSLAAGADAPFPANSVPAYVLRSTSVTTVSGYPSESSTNDWYLDANYRYMGAVDGDGYCEVATQSALPPAYAKIGSYGTLATFELYDSCGSGATLLGTGSLQWSLELAGGQTYFCLFNQGGYRGGTSYAEKDCMTIDVNGVIGQSATITSSLISTDGVTSLNLSTN